MDGETRQKLIAENARLREELEHANVLIKKISEERSEVAPNAMPSGSHCVGAGKALATDHALPPPPSHRAVPSVRTQRDTDAILIDMAGSALQEFCALVRVGMPMWLPTPDGEVEVLNFQKYAETMFPSIFGHYWVGSVKDGTRKTGDVQRTADNLVAILMDAVHTSPHPYTLTLVKFLIFLK
jgi:homeobox-leucine zipper protein